MPEIVIHATVNVTINGNASERDVRTGVRKGLNDIIEKVRGEKRTGGF